MILSLTVYRADMILTLKLLYKSDLNTDLDLTKGNYLWWL